jgi:hypothetical protein
VQNDGKKNDIGLKTLKRYLEAVFGKDSPESQRANSDPLTGHMVKVYLTQKQYKGRDWVEGDELEKGQQDQEDQRGLSPPGVAVSLPVTPSFLMTIAAKKRGFKYFFLKGLIEIDGACWLWMGAQYKDGYGMICRRARPGEAAFKLVGRRAWRAVTAE